MAFEAQHWAWAQFLTVTVTSLALLVVAIATLCVTALKKSDVNVNVTPNVGAKGENGKDGQNGTDGKVSTSLKPSLPLSPLQVSLSLSQYLRCLSTAQIVSKCLQGEYWLIVTLSSVGYVAVVVRKAAMARSFW